MNLSRNRARFLRLLSLLAVAACSPSGPREDPQAQLRQRRHELVAHFSSVQDQIRTVQRQALDSPTVKPVQSAFYQTLRARMIQIDPRAESWLDRATRVGKDLRRIAGDTAATAEEKRRVAGELRELDVAMRSVQQRALEDPEVAARLAVLQDTLVAVMNRIDPRAQLVVNQMHEIETKIAEVDRQLAGDSVSGGSRGWKSDVGGQ